MDRRELYPEDEGVFETSPETPALVRDFVEAGLDYEPNADEIPSGELGLFERPLMGADSLALRLFEEFEDSAHRSDTGEFFYLYLNFVPSPETTDESNVIEFEYGDDYVISDAYARYRMRLTAVQEPYRTPRGGEALRYSIVHVGVRDKLEKGTGFEIFLNHDDSIDADFAVDGRYCGRRRATPNQQLIVATMINELLNPVAASSNESEPDDELDPDLQ